MTQARPAKLSREEIAERCKSLADGWKVVDHHHLEKSWEFRNFKQALEFTNKLGAVAEELNHHPDIYLAWGLVRATIYTHSSDGLTEFDFKLAGRIDQAK